MEIVYLKDPEAKSIISKHLTVPPVILAGSAISAWEPTCLPIGEAFTKGMFDLLFPSQFLENNSNLIEHLDNLWRKVPFEHLLERCPNHKKLTPLIKRTFAIDRFNPVHEAIAEASIGGKFQGIITTNYDLCLDKLLANAKNITRVVTKNEFQSADVSTQRIYFKIHGSADDKEGETLVWALSHESYLPDWKRKLLSDLIKGRSLLIIGYSGLDFEICPEILKMPVKNVFWNIREEKDKREDIENQNSPNARRFLKELPGYLLVGDMQTLLSLLIRPVNATWGKSSNSELFDSIKEEFTELEIGIWRASLLNSIGCASIALKASRELLARSSQSKVDSIDKVDLVSLRRGEAQALFHTGKYYQSAKEFYRATKKFDLNAFLRIALLLDSCDAYRCYGSILRAFLRLNEARREIQRIATPKERRQLEGRAALKEVLIWRHLYQITKALKIPFLANFIQKKTINLLRLASKTSLESGNWFEFQQTRFWAERLNIDPVILAYQIPYEPPPPKEGYEHLGYHVAQSMYLRDQLNKAKCHLSQEEELSLEEHISTCATFGNYPELWKLCFIGLKWGNTKNKIGYATLFLKAFFFCEYTVRMRLFQLILGD